MNFQAIGHKRSFVMTVRKIYKCLKRMFLLSIISESFFCYNFGLHDLKTNNAVMYLYPENYAKKGCNEVISFINFYIRNIMLKEVKTLHIFSDNAFSQNKNNFLWAFYKQIIDCEPLEKIVIHYPNPVHSVMEIDGDFGRIEINKKITKKYIFHQNMKE